MITSPRIIALVVGTAATMAATFLVTLALLLLGPGVLLAFGFHLSQISGDGVAMADKFIVLFDKLLSAFVTAGMSAMSFLFGTLVNTRTQAAPAAADPTPVIVNNAVDHPANVAVQPPPARPEPQIAANGPVLDASGT